MDGEAMDAMEAILSRRSIRKYIKKPISNEIVKELLEAGMSAPSAGNEQPWNFIVIKDPKILKKIPSFHNHAHMLNDASLAILVCNDKHLEKHGEMWIQDCSAATENILLAVNAKGLGAVWLGIYPREERIDGMRKLLDIPEHIVPFSLVSIGYPAEKKPQANRYDASRIHQNKW
jgi:nitroreductase